VVVEQREAPAVVADVVDAGEAPEPFEVPRRRRLEEALPLVPQSLRVPVHPAARERARSVETEDSLVAVAGAAHFAGDAGRGALLAGQSEEAELGPADGNTHSPEQALAAVIVEHRVGPSVPGAIDREIV